VDGLFEQFKERSALQKPYVLTLYGKGINADAMVLLFGKIRDAGIELKATAAIDLDGNSLGAAKQQHFAVVLQAMQQPGMHSLQVRFGFEVSAIELKTALTELNLDNWWNQRIFISSAWVDNGYAESIIQLTAIAQELKNMNISQTKRLQQLETRSDNLERAQINKDELTDLKNFINTDALALEKHVSNAVAEALEDSNIISASRYNFDAWNGDVDGVVVGTWQGSEVVVLIEAKHNMDTSSSKAVRALKSAHEYWRLLVGADTSSDFTDEIMQTDYDELQIAANKGRAVMYALGSALMSDTTAKQLDRCIENDRRLAVAGWFSVQPSNGHFAATQWVPRSISNSSSSTNSG
jgi:hypothetical protein